ncbi:hypothetical protein BGW41_005361 [Actinomortierella wolfii]|nr:hypothetical protein BGW41_005361 [Actinomortierella wolfii]
MEDMEDSWNVDEDLQIEEFAATQQQQQEQHQEESWGEFGAMTNDVEEDLMENTDHQMSSSSFAAEEPEIPMPGPTTSFTAVTTTTTSSTATTTTTATTTATTISSSHHTITSMSLEATQAALGIQETGEAESAWGFDMEDIDAATVPTSLTPLPVNPAHDNATSPLLQIEPETNMEVDGDAWGVDEDIMPVEVISTSASAITTTTTTTTTSTSIVAEAATRVESIALTEQEVNASLSMATEDNQGGVAVIEASWGLDEDINLDISPAPTSYVPAPNPESTPIEAPAEEHHIGIVSTETEAVPQTHVESTSENLEVSVQSEDPEAAWGFNEEVLEPMAAIPVATNEILHHFAQEVEEDDQETSLEPQSGFEEHTHEDNPVLDKDEYAFEAADTSAPVSVEMMAEEQVHDIGEDRDHDHGQSFSDGHESDDSSPTRTSRVSLDSVNAAYSNEVRNVLFSDNDTPFMAVQDSTVYEQEQVAGQSSSESSDEAERDSASSHPATFYGSITSTTFATTHHFSKGTPEPLNGFSSPRRSDGSSSTPLEMPSVSTAEDDLIVASQYGHAYGYEELYTTAATNVTADQGVDADAEDSGSEILRELSTARMARTTSSNRLDETNDDDDFLEHMERGVPMDLPISTPESQSDDERGNGLQGVSLPVLEDDLVDLLERGETGPSPPTSSRVVFGTTSDNENASGIVSEHRSDAGVANSGTLLTVRDEVLEDDDQRSLAVETSGSPISTIASAISVTAAGAGEDMEIEMEHEGTVDDQMSMMVETSTISSFDSRSVSAAFTVATATALAATSGAALSSTGGVVERDVEGEDGDGVDPAGLGFDTNEPPFIIDAKDELVPMVDGVPVPISMLADTSVDAAIFQQQAEQEQLVQGVLDQEAASTAFAFNQTATVEDEMGVEEQVRSEDVPAETLASVASIHHQETSSISFEPASTKVELSRSSVAMGAADEWGWSEEEELDLSNVNQPTTPIQQLGTANEPSSAVAPSTTAEEPVAPAQQTSPEDLFATSSANIADDVPAAFLPGFSSSSSFTMTSHQTVSHIEESRVFSIEQNPAVSPAPAVFEEESGDVSELFTQHQESASYGHSDVHHLFAPISQPISHPFPSSTPSPGPSGAAAIFASSTSSSISPAPVHHDDDVAIPFVFGGAIEQPVPSPPIPKHSPSLETPQQQQEELEPQVEVAEVGEDAWNDDQQLLEELDQMLEGNSPVVSGGEPSASAPLEPTISSSSPSSLFDVTQHSQPESALASSLDTSLSVTASMMTMTSAEEQQSANFADVLFAPASQGAAAVNVTEALTTTTSLVEQAIAEDEEEAVFEIATAVANEQMATPIVQESRVEPEQSGILEEKEALTLAESNHQALVVDGMDYNAEDGWGQDELEIAIEAKVQECADTPSSVHQDTHLSPNVTADIEVDQFTHSSNTVERESESFLIDTPVVSETVKHEDISYEGNDIDDQLGQEGTSEQGEDEAIEKLEEDVQLDAWDEDVGNELTELEGLQLDQVIEEQAAQVASLEHPEESSCALAAASITAADSSLLSDDVGKIDVGVEVDYAEAPHGIDVHSDVHVHHEQEARSESAFDSKSEMNAAVVAGVAAAAAAGAMTVAAKEMGSRSEEAPLPVEEPSTQKDEVEEEEVVEKVAEDQIQQQHEQSNVVVMEDATTASTGENISASATSMTVDILQEEDVGDGWGGDEGLDFGLVSTQLPAEASAEELSVTQGDSHIAALEQEMQVQEDQEHLHEQREHEEMRVLESDSYGQQSSDAIVDKVLAELETDRMREMDGDDGWGQEGVDFEIQPTNVSTTTDHHEQPEPQSPQQQDDVTQTVKETESVEQVITTTTVDSVANVGLEEVTASNSEDDGWDEGDVALQIEQPVAVTSVTETKTTTTTTISTTTITETSISTAESSELKAYSQVETDAWGHEESSLSIHGLTVDHQLQQEIEKEVEVTDTHKDEEPQVKEHKEPALLLDAEVEDAWGHEDIVFQAQSAVTEQELQVDVSSSAVEEPKPSSPPLQTTPPQDNQENLTSLELAMEEDAWGLEADLVTVAAGVTSAQHAESTDSVVTLVKHETAESTMTTATTEEHVVAESGWEVDGEEDLLQQIERQIEQQIEDQKQVSQTMVDKADEVCQQARDHVESASISVSTTERHSHLHYHDHQDHIASSITSSVTPPPRPELLKEQGAVFSADSSDMKMEPLSSHSEGSQNTNDGAGSISVATGSSGEHSHKVGREEELEDSSSWQDISPASAVSKHSDAIVSVMGSEAESEFMTRSMVMIREEHRTLSGPSSSSTSSSSLAAVAMEPSLSWTDLKHERENESSGEWQHDSVGSVASDKKDESSLEDLLKDSGDGWGDMDDIGLEAPSVDATMAAPAVAASTKVDAPSRNNTPSPSIFINRPPPGSDHSLSPTSPVSTSSITSASMAAVAAVAAVAATTVTSVEEEEDDSHLPQAIRKQRARLRAMGKPLPPISKYKSKITTPKATESSSSSALSPTGPSFASPHVPSTTDNKSTLLSPALQKQRERLEKKRAASKSFSSSSSSTAAMTSTTTATSATNPLASPVGRSSLAATLSSPIGVLGESSTGSMSISSASLSGMSSRNTMQTTTATSSSKFTALSDVSGQTAGHGVLSPRLSTESRPSLDDSLRRTSPRRGSTATSIMSSSSPVLHARHVHHHQYQSMTTGSPLMESSGVISRKSKDLERRISTSLSPRATVGTSDASSVTDTVEVVHSSETDVYAHHHHHVARSKNVSSTSSSSIGGGWEIESHWDEHEFSSTASGSVPQTPTLHHRGDHGSSHSSSSAFGLGTSAVGLGHSNESSGWGSLTGDILGMSKSISEQQQRSAIGDGKGDARGIEETSTTGSSSFFRQSVPGLDTDRDEDSRSNDEDRYGGKKKAPPAALSLSSSTFSANESQPARGALPKSSSSSWSLGSWVSSAVAVASSAVDRAYESLDPDYSRMKRGITSPDDRSTPSPLSHSRPGYIAGGSSLALGQASILTPGQQQRERSMSSSSSGSFSQPPPYPHPHAHLHHPSSPNLSRKSYSSEHK